MVVTRGKGVWGRGSDGGQIHGDGGDLTLGGQHTMKCVQMYTDDVL